MKVKKQNIIELKVIDYNLSGCYDPLNKGVEFTRNQTRVIPRMKFPPYIIIFDHYLKENYLLTPEWIKREFPIYPAMSKSVIKVKKSYFSKPISYRSLLQLLSENN